MAAIGGNSGIFSRESNILNDFPAVFETETKTLCLVRMALEVGSLIIVRHKGEVRLKSNLPFKTDSKTILRIRVVRFRGQTLVVHGTVNFVNIPIQYRPIPDFISLTRRTLLSLLCGSSGPETQASQAGSSDLSMQVILFLLSDFVAPKKNESSESREAHIRVKSMRTLSKRSFLI
jgi:hypothetical protein